MGALYAFVRIRVSLTIALIAAFGYLSFNRPGIGLLFAALSALFLSFGAYGDNSMTDRDEDRINRGASPLVGTGPGRAIVALSFAAGIVTSLPLGMVSALTAAAICASALSYSHLRLKRFLLVKNLYTGFAVSLSFVLGAGRLSQEVLLYYASVSLFFLIGSIVSDLRDYRGDKKAGIKTLPVCLGPERTKHAVYSLLALFALLFLMGNRSFLALSPLLFTAPVICILVIKDRPHVAHLAGGISTILMVFWACMVAI